MGFPRKDFGVKRASAAASRTDYRQLPADADWVQISLGHAQLLSLRFAQEIHTRSMTGSHWISWDGRDLILEEGQVITLGAGWALIDGEGGIQFAPVTRSRHWRGFAMIRRWLGRASMAHRVLALRIDIQ